MIFGYIKLLTKYIQKLLLSELIDIVSRIGTTRPSVHGFARGIRQRDACAVTITAAAHFPASIGAASNLPHRRQCDFQRIHAHTRVHARMARET